MADEVEILTTNEAGDSWVDVEPGAVSTGYQNQNTNIEAQRIGIDESTLTWDGGTSELVLEISGVMDENGLPFVVKSEVRLTIASNNTWYIRLIAGSTTDKRSVQLTTSPGTWDSALNGYYISGDRVLNWVIIKTSGISTPEICRRQLDDDSAGLALTGPFIPRTNAIEGSQSIAASGSYVLPRGLYMIHVNTLYDVQIFVNSSWVGASRNDLTMCVVSDGTNVRVNNNTVGTITLRYLKF